MPYAAATDLMIPALAIAPRELYIGGVWRASTSGATFAVTNPATGEELAQVADGTPADGMAALAAATRAQEAWADTAPRERSELLRAAFERVHELGDEFAALMSLEVGKPLAEGHSEVTYGAEFLRWFAEEAVRINGRYTSTPEGNLRVLTVKRPVGPCLFITPWNYPLAMVTRKLAPALAAGCTTILKPSDATPLTALAFAKVCQEVGIPAGVVNVVPTWDAAPMTGPIIADPRLRKLSFTGSTATGRALLKQAADNVLRVSMELGGCAPFLVFSDADLDHAVACAQATKLRNMGQACNAANRFYVEEPIADEFARKLADAFGSQRTGDPFDPATTVGSLISSAQRDKVAAMVDEAVAGGAQALIGGHKVDGPGFFFQPTVLANVQPTARVASEEIFGPVAPVVAFETEEQALTWANASPVGLAAYVHTGDLKRALRMTERLQSGMISINSATISNAAAPFGGIKHSGLGREGGSEGIEEYLETVYVGLPNPLA